MNPEIQTKLDEIEKKIDAVFVSAEKTRKYILWTGIVTLVLFILPIIGLAFAIPSFISSYTSTLNTYIQ